MSDRTVDTLRVPRRKCVVCRKMTVLAKDGVPTCKEHGGEVDG